MRHRVSIKINNDVLTDAINSLNKHSIMIQNCEYKDESSYLYIEEKNYHKAKRVLKKIQSDKYLFGEYSKVKNRISILLRYVIVIIGVISLLGINMYRDKYCNSLDVDGVEGELKHNIINCIKQEIKLPLLKTSINFNALEIKVIDTFESVAFCEIELIDNSIKVHVNTVKLDDARQKQYVSIHAKSDAIVTKVLVTSGTAAIKAGDVVKKGDLLIDGKVESKVEGEEPEKVSATGCVYGRTWYSEKICLSKNRVMMVETGKTSVKRQLYIGKYVFGNNKPKYKYSSSLSIENKLFSLLPIKIVKTTYKEMAQSFITIDNDSIEEVIANTKMKILETLPENCEVLDDWVTKKEVDNLLILDIYYEVEECISIGEE